VTRPLKILRDPADAIRDFIDSEAGGGLVLMASAALALVVANSPASSFYFDALSTYVLGLSIQHWVNDGLMALFFLLVGLEIKRELLLGELATWGDRVLPGFAAVGGMAVPAVIYLIFNFRGPGLDGWAIPTATDIAFSLGVLALLGSRIPASLKIFLTALAIIDDLGAVIVIAVFYTTAISPLMIGLAAATMVALIVLNRAGVVRLWPYLGLGVALWIFVHESGLHATLAGVLLAATIPSRGGEEPPLDRLEHGIGRFVGFVVLPVFGFANAGVALGGIGLAQFGDPITLGVSLGLFVGKQVGVFGGAALAILTRVARMPAGASWRQLYGVAVLCGIGFTMSLFIGLLAFPPEHEDATKIGVLAGSVVSALVGWAILASASRVRRTEAG
jgi:NhaA family Na+:H+ antiporter